MAAKPRLDLAWFSCDQQLLPSFHQRRQVFRMESGFPAPAMRLFRGQACVVVPSFIEEFVRTIGQIAPGECWNSVNHLSKSCFRFLDLTQCSSESFLGPLPFDCNTSNVSSSFDQFKIFKARSSGLAI